MFERLTWLPDRALLDDLVFHLEQARTAGGEEAGDGFAFYKNRQLVEQFERFWSTTAFRPRRMLEIGIWDGGSTAFWFEHLRPERLVAIDLKDREDSPYFRRWVASRGLAGRVVTHWRSDQADRAGLRQIVERDLGGELDFVIDDGSHLAAPTQASFEVLFPLLPPGGLYIIEDWAWEHWPDFQDPGHFWASEEGLSALVCDLLAATGSSRSLIRSLTAYEGFVVVERGPGGERGPDGVSGSDGERGPDGVNGSDGVSGSGGERGPGGEHRPEGARILDGSPDGERSPNDERGRDDERGTDGERSKSGESRRDFHLGDHIVRRPWRAGRAAASQVREEGEVRIVAFYLPQFHPIPENDRWWGKGYTEWSRVARARPRFNGHYQPHLPERLGFYDLRLPEARARQAALARGHGVHAFCYYYYWFGTKTLLERPLVDMLAGGEPDLPYCLCWANENWTRRWDGADQELLIEQRYGPELDSVLIDNLMPFFRDPRYLRVHGAPVLVVYRPSAIPEPRATLERWRHTARQHGLPDLHLVAAQTFGLQDPRPLGFDAAVEFPPHGENLPENSCPVEGIEPGFAGEVVDFRSVAARRVALPPPPFRLYRTAMAGWDNTSRLGDRAAIFHGASPAIYESWLGALVAAARLEPAAHRLVFVNAWNEWAEGAHLEPDQRFGTGYLEATRRALARFGGAK
jgi:hypothetical protein